MLKNILKLEGALELTRNEQKSINGGICESQRRVCGYTPASCRAAGGVPSGTECCVFGQCLPGQPAPDLCVVNPLACL